MPPLEGQSFDAKFSRQVIYMEKPSTHTFSNERHTYNERETAKVVKLVYIYTAEMPRKFGNFTSYALLFLFPMLILTTTGS